MKQYMTDFWEATLAQQASKMKLFFAKDAYINWHNTNEHFTVEEFIHANCEYPGTWQGEMERFIQVGQELITVVHVHSKDETLSFHVTSFFQLSKDHKIISIDEYWGDDGIAPQWRLDKHIGTTI